MFGKGFELALLICIKLSENGRVSSASELASWLGVSLNFTHQILHKLKKRGLIITKRGTKGGVQLSRRPEEIMVADIIECIEPAAFEISCNKRRIFSFCDRSNQYCSIRRFMEDVYGSIKAKLKTPLAQFKTEEFATLCASRGRKS